MRRAALLVAGALLGACESGSRFPPASSSFEDFCASWTVAVKSAFERCEGLPADVLDVSWCARAEMSQAEGRLAYDGSLAPACVRDWQNASCDDVLAENIPGCLGIVRGLVPDRGACTTDDECDDFSTCVATGVAACGGVCRLVVKVGAACGGDQGDCATAASCVGDASGTVCVARVGVGAACSDMTPCLFGLACAPHGAAPPRCQWPAALGQPCDATSACGPYAICEAGVCALEPATGEACGAAAASTDCLDGWCDAPPGADGVCRAWLHAGDVCGFDAQCTGALVCFNGACGSPTCPPAP
jgi:hypothetical protein